MVNPRPSPLLPIVLIIVVIAGSGVGIGLLYEHNNPTPGAPARTVAVGDNVTVNYIGIFANGPQAGRVFDTSIYSVATNNVSYPKSLQFSFRGSAANYTPLGVSVGPNIPSSGYSINGITFGGVVTGFWQGLLGLPAGKTQTISFPPDLGYGPENSSCLVPQPLSFTVPVLNPVAQDSFATLYPGVSPTLGTQFTDPTYKWTDLVFSVNATTVVVEYLPTVGWTVPSGSWPVLVTNISGGTISLENQLSPSQAGLVAGHVAGSGTCGSTEFIVSAVDPVAGTYTEDFNPEVRGESLEFVVTVVAFY
jgi:FKBP-type peptidyl-prolyl cis-trans isomerase 2